MRQRLTVLLLPLLFFPAISHGQTFDLNAPQKPKVRTVTAFIRLDRATYRSQVADALKLLHAAKDALTKAGYEVETIRITTQPFPEYTRGLSAEQALQFLRDFYQLSAFEQAEMILYAALDPTIASKARQGDDEPLTAQ